MLETAEEMDELGITPRNKVRFIFFSGEEQGLLGSDYYVSQLTKKQIQDTSVMLDFDMLASPNYGRFIYDGNGDEQAPQVRTALDDRAGSFSARCANKANIRPPRRPLPTERSKAYAARFTDPIDVSRRQKYS
jgi:Zn-dependent M28 family amino/carboxypeptidase